MAVGRSQGSNMVCFFGKHGICTGFAELPTAQHELLDYTAFRD